MSLAPGDAEQDHDEPISDGGRMEWRLRIWHFFAWTGVAAVLLALLVARRQVLADQDVRLQGLLDILSVWSAFSTLLTAIAACLTVEGVVRRVRFGREFPGSPGEAIAVIMASELILQLSALLVRLPWRYDRHLDFTRQLILFAIGTAVHVGVAVLVVRYVRELCEPAWRRALYALAAVELLAIEQAAAMSFFPATSAAHLLSLLSTLVSIVATILLIAVVVSELREGEPRPWPHWVGVGSYLAAKVIALITYLSVAWYSMMR